jgi:hypothetical protein
MFFFSNTKHMLNKTKKLNRRIKAYISRKDICCEDEFDRKVLIEEIFRLYAMICDTSSQRIDCIHNDITKLIGYTVLMKGDLEGLEIKSDLDRLMLKGKDLSQAKIVKLLHKLPLFYVLSLLGYAQYILAARRLTPVL